MCRHCERLVVHPEDRDLIHAFMERTALRVTELHAERDLPPVAADDIDLKIEVLVSAPLPNPAMSEAAGRIIRDLDEMHR